jgi:rsbT co-antagonist protein RsbR
MADTTMSNVLKKNGKEIQASWAKDLAGQSSGNGRISAAELNQQAGEFINLLGVASEHAKASDISAPEFKPIREFLEGISRSRVQQGFSSDETASFIFSLKKPLFAALRADAGKDADALADQVWRATELLDALGLHTVKAYQKSREEVINRQQREMLELSTPVVKLWEGVLALPMIGTLDSARTQVVMETLLQKVVETGAQIAILDITGVPTVDTLVAQHLLKTVTALRLMGAECIISGVRPQIAQTIVHLGVDLQGVTTKANLADALALALKRTGNSLRRARRRIPGSPGQAGEGRGLDGRRVESHAPDVAAAVSGTELIAISRLLPRNIGERMGLSGIFNGDEDDLLAKDRRKQGTRSGVSLRFLWLHRGALGEGTGFPDGDDDEYDGGHGAERERREEKTERRNQR